MADDALGNMLGGLIWLFFVVAAAMAVVAALMSLGAFYGGGSAIRNYCLAFRDHVHFQKVAP